jgi:hypothetical protein
VVEALCAPYESYGLLRLSANLGVGPTGRSKHWILRHRAVQPRLADEATTTMANNSCVRQQRPDTRLTSFRALLLLEPRTMSLARGFITSSFLRH